MSAANPCRHIVALLVGTLCTMAVPAQAESSPGRQGDLAARVSNELEREGLSLERLGFALSITDSAAAGWYVTLRSLADPATSRVRVVPRVAEGEAAVAELVVVVDGMLRASGNSTESNPRQESSPEADSLAQRLRVADAVYDRTAPMGAEDFSTLLLAGMTLLPLIADTDGSPGVEVVPVSIVAGSGVVALGSSFFFDVTDSRRKTVPTVTLLAGLGASLLVSDARDGRLDFDTARTSLGLGYLASAVGAGIIGALHPPCTPAAQRAHYEALAAAEEADGAAQLAELEGCVARQEGAFASALAVSLPMLAAAGGAFYAASRAPTKEDRLMHSFLGGVGLLAAGLLQYSWGGDIYAETYRELVTDQGLQVGVGPAGGDGGMGVTVHGQF